MNWCHFLRLRSIKFSIRALSRFYKKWKDKKLTHLDFNTALKLVNNKNLLIEIKNEYFCSIPKVPNKVNKVKTNKSNHSKKENHLKEIKNILTKEMAININFKIEKNINDPDMIKMCEKLVSEHLDHLVSYNNNIKGKYYELLKSNHIDLQKKVYILNIDKPWGKQNLVCVDEKYDLYRPGSTVKLGNIKKDEYLFVRGKIAYYYVNNLNEND